MNYIVAGCTDIGTTKETNQDSLSVKVLTTKQGRMVFAILCDGMGGLEKGEVASATVIRRFDQWVQTDLRAMTEYPLDDTVIRSQWETILKEENQKIMTYGARMGIRLGTTAVIMLITAGRYYVMNVGDSRAYELHDGIRQLTNDQTFVAREVAMGNMTEEEAENDERRSVLLQCVGASDYVYPDMFFGDTKKDAVYLLCSDGFRHEIKANEIYSALHPNLMLNEESMNSAVLGLIELNKQRQETDNISAVLIRTY